MKIKKKIKDTACDDFTSCDHCPFNKAKNCFDYASLDPEDEVEVDIDYNDHDDKTDEVQYAPSDDD